MTKNSLQQVQLININDIHVLNPRVRNPKIFQDIKDNIHQVGLKRPITITKSSGSSDKSYNLVCGQGRLEAFIANGEVKIPAMIVEADEEKNLIMSLVENLARRQHNSLDLLKGIELLYDKSYSNSVIAAKTGLSLDYINQIIKLIERGEERLLAAVEGGRIPLNVAVKIALSPGEEQRALQEAYESNQLKGKKLLQAQKLIERRRTRGKTIKSERCSSKDLGRTRALTGQDVLNMYKKEVSRKRSLTRKAEEVNNHLFFIKGALNKLYQEDHFNSILKAEGFKTLPSPIANLLKENKKPYE